jgi:hypothetical protein
VWGLVRPRKGKSSAARAGAAEAGNFMQAAVPVRVLGGCWQEEGKEKKKNER